MAIYKFPVLVWEDFEGYFTASLIEPYPECAGIGRTAAEAIFQIKDHLAWNYEKYPWFPAPDFVDAELTHFKVEVRPEYRIDNKIYPLEQPIALRVACVHGRQEGGLFVCAIPMLEIHFYYYEAAALRDLVTTYVQEILKGLTPQALARRLPPKAAALDEIVLQVARKERGPQPPDLENLIRVAEPLGDRALRKQFSSAWEREREVADLVARLVKEKANVILVGESGVGKTTVLVNAARNAEQQIQEAAGKRDLDDDKGAAQYKHKFWLTSGARLIAAMQYLGQWEARTEAVIGELSEIGGALCASSLLDLVLTGGREPSASIAAFLLPYVQRGELHLVTEATPAELDACRRLLPGFVGMFQILHLPAFSPAQAVAILKRALDALQRNHRVAASEAIAGLTYRLFQRFAPYQAFPGRTIAFLSAVFERAEVEGQSEITNAQIIARFVLQTGLPEVFLRDETVLAYADVLDHFNRQVLGQPAPCAAAAALVTTFKAGLNDPNRPLGVLLFCGPTGVGKTELAKAISRFFFGHGEQKDRLVRLDMSEYSGPGAAERLIHSPDGTPSDLIKKVRQQPFVVVLLDEIEKAGPDVFDALLGVFDEGRLTDRFGRTATFRSAVIIMTSNLGSDKIGGIGFDPAATPSYSAEAMSFFRPEFYNRIDAIVRFEPLDHASIMAITRKELAELAEREGLTAAGLRLTWTERLVEHLAREGYDPRYGARPLQRTIEVLVVAPLARRLVENPELEGKTILADLGDGELMLAITADLGV